MLTGHLMILGNYNSCFRRDDTIVLRYMYPLGIHTEVFMDEMI